ncbi:MAG: prepilin peptidase [Hyphomicrobiales bacterium]|nr:prepilin peptidase [Hyphomicrobiales bacterium]
MLHYAILIVFPALMIFAAVSDVLTMKIPNRISLLLIAGFFPLAFATGLDLPTIGWHVAAGLGVLAIGFVLFSFRLLGGGDAKLAGATALWLGGSLLPIYGYLTVIAGGLLAAVIFGLRMIPLSEGLQARGWIARLHNKTEGVPYGVALAAGGLLVYPASAIWLAAAGA